MKNLHSYNSKLRTVTALAALTVSAATTSSVFAEDGEADPDTLGMYADIGSDDKSENKSYRPKFNKQLRQNEDWSNFDPTTSDRSGFYNHLDQIKHINLTDDGEVWISFGGSARARYEHYENYKFTPHYDDGYLLTRALLHGDLHVGENFRVFVQGKTAFSTDRDLSGGQRTADSDELALQQAFADFRLPIGQNSALTFRPGRQMLSFGNQRLVSSMEWRNTMLTWDGVSVILDYHDWNAHSFWAQSVPVQKYDFNSSDEQTQLFGVYATGPVCDEYGVNMDAYFLGVDIDDPITFNGTTGPERRYTVGGRLFGNAPGSGLDYDFEAAYQFGDLGSGDIQAWTVGSEIGYTFDCSTAFRPFIGVDIASGDSSSGGDVETFNQLYALEHAFLGYVDMVGRQNVIDVTTGFSFKPMKKLTARAAYHCFWRQSTNDALYNSSGVLIAGAAAGDRFIGSEIDLTLKYKLDANTKLMFGYSHFFTGDFIDNGAPTKRKDIDSVKFQIEWTY